MFSNFSATDKIGKFIEFDDYHDLFKVNGRVYRIMNVADIEYVEQGASTRNKGGILSAIVGGFVAGKVGAIVGSVVGTYQEETIRKISIVIELKYGEYDKEAIVIARGKIKTDGLLYDSYVDTAEKVITKLAERIEYLSR